MKKRILIPLCITLLSFILNGVVFVFSYNKLATPFITEEQRVVNADFIMSVTAGSLATVSLVIGLFVYLAMRNR